jgi:RND family efflux transporter MFP subunit
MRRLADLAVLAALAAATACSSDTSQAAPAATPGRSAPGAGAGARGGGPAVTLAAADVATLARGVLETGPPITGDLRPIETIVIRARLEGDLDVLRAREGQRVAAGELLARFDALEEDAALRSAQADREAARAEAATAEWDRDQARELFKAGAIAERELRTAEQTAAGAAARLAASEARVRAAEQVVRDTRVTAPVAGTVERRTVQEGERVSRNAELFTLVRSDVLELVATVPARQASEVAPGQVVRFAADGRAFTGRIARVSPTIDPVSRSVSVFVQVPNADGALKGNTFASGRVVAQAVPDALLLPVAAIRQTQGGDRPFVYRIDGEALAVVPVTLGAVDEPRGVAEVRDGLAEGDRVVVGNVGTLGRGMRVQLLGGDRGARADGATPGAATPRKAP